MCLSPSQHECTQLVRTWQGVDRKAARAMPKARPKCTECSSEGAWHEDGTTCGYCGRGPLCTECLKPKVHRCAELERSHGWIFIPGGAKALTLRPKVKAGPTAEELANWQLSTSEAKARVLSRMFAQAKAKAKSLGTELMAPPPCAVGCPKARMAAGGG